MDYLSIHGRLDVLKWARSDPDDVPCPRCLHHLGRQLPMKVIGRGKFSISYHCTQCGEDVAVRL